MEEEKKAGRLRNTVTWNQGEGEKNRIIKEDCGETYQEIVVIVVLFYGSPH